MELWLSFIYGCYNGAMVVYLTEVMPASVRTSGFSLAYSLATVLGGMTPAIATGLIRWSHDTAIPGAWMSCAADSRPRGGVVDRETGQGRPGRRSPCLRRPAKWKEACHRLLD